jgi:hypothetical protein
MLLYVVISESDCAESFSSHDSLMGIFLNKSNADKRALTFGFTEFGRPSARVEEWYVEDDNSTEEGK